jgi:hypothetical protein
MDRRPESSVGADDVHEIHTHGEDREAIAFELEIDEAPHVVALGGIWFLRMLIMRKMRG